MEDNPGMSVSRSDLLAGGAKIDTGPCIDRSSEFLFVPLKERQQIIDVQCSATWKGRNEWMTEKSWLCAIKVDSFWRDENEGNTCANCVSQMSELILSNFAFCFVWFVWLSLAQMWERERNLVFCLESLACLRQLQQHCEEQELLRCARTLNEGSRAQASLLI